MKYETANGHTVESIIARIDEGFTGKAVVSGNCQYLTDDGKRCAIGLFIPDGHPGQLLLQPLSILLDKYPDLLPQMPLSNTEALAGFQSRHDSLPTYLSPNEQKETLKAWIKDNCVDSVSTQAAKDGQ